MSPIRHSYIVQRREMKRTGFLSYIIILCFIGLLNCKQDKKPMQQRLINTHDQYIIAYNEFIDFSVGLLELKCENSKLYQKAFETKINTLIAKGARLDSLGRLCNILEGELGRLALLDNDWCDYVRVTVIAIKYELDCLKQIGPTMEISQGDYNTFLNQSYPKHKEMLKQILSQRGDCIKKLGLNSSLQMK